MYKNKEGELVLVLFSDLYSELDKIFVDTSRPSTSSTLYYLLTTYLTALIELCILIFIRRKSLS